MAETGQNAQVYAGEDKTLRFTVDNRDPQGVVTGQVDLTGATVTWKLGAVSKTVGAGVTVVNAVGGIVEVQLDPADTQATTTKTATPHELRIVDAAGNVSTVATGVITVLPTLHT